MFGWLMSALSLAALKGEASNIADRIKRSALITAILAVIWVAALVFALIAIAIWLSGGVGAVAACGILAAALVLIGLVIMLIVTLSKKKAPAPSPLGFSIPGLTAASGATASSPQGSNVASMAVVALAGYMLGRQFFGK